MVGLIRRFLWRPIAGLLERWGKAMALALGGDAARRRRRAHQLVRGLSAELHRLGFSRRSFKGRKKSKLQRVRFESPLLLTRDELWVPIDLRRLPNGVRTNELREEDALRSIEERLNTLIRLDSLANGKLCFVLRISGQAFPEIMPISAFKLPADAPTLAFPLGLDGEGGHAWADLAALPHLLVVGPTMKGKSTFVHTMLTTWISRNTDRDIELWLADHKGGVELNRYRDLMGGRTRAGIVRRFSYQPSETIEFLLAAMRELDRRNEVLRQADCSDVADYARNTGQHLRRIVIVIDEIFFLMLNKEKVDPDGQSGKGMTISAWAEHLFAKLASAGRAAGIHLVIATQRIGKDVLTPLITANFETRAVFGVADMYQSIYIIGDSSAVGLPAGRIVFRSEGGQMREIQTPLIKPDQTRLLIHRIARYGPDGGLGKADEARRFAEDAKLLVTVACEEYEGRIAVNEIWQHARIKGAIRKDRVVEICKRLERDEVLLAGGPRKARRVATAYFGRPELLDTIYGPQAAPRQPEEPPGNAQQPTAPTAPTTPPAGPQKPQQAAEAPTVVEGEVEDIPDPTPPPDPYRRLFEDLGEG